MERIFSSTDRDALEALLRDRTVTPRDEHERLEVRQFAWPSLNYRTYQMEGEVKWGIYRHGDPSIVQHGFLTVTELAERKTN